MFDFKALQEQPNPVLLIAGATAVGKSGFALEVARQRPSVIINADSMQVYDALPILTAQPSQNDTQGVPHKLYGSIALDQICSAAHWAQLAKAEITAAWNAGLTPIVVGGTGLYLRTLHDGISPIPDIDPQVRAQVRALHDAKGGAAVRDLLSQHDEVLATRLEVGDSQRLCRALEVALSTGRPLSDWQQQRPTGGLFDMPGVSIARLVLEMDRAALYQRCNQRLEQMIADGALEELEAVLARDIDPTHPLMRAVGIPPLKRYLGGEISKIEAIEKAQQDTRRFAKRQMTWNRNQFGKWSVYKL